MVCRPIFFFFGIKNVSYKGHVKKIIQFSEAEVAANFDINPISSKFHWAHL